MLALGISYLNRWAMATHPAKRESPEWPPHPDRVFMALAAAHFETDGDDTERGTLEWLEGQGPPEVIASDERRRETVTTFVPVNDSANPIKKNKPLMPAGSMPLGRDRQRRQFPVAVPDDPTVYLVWPLVQPTPEQRTALDRLTAKVTAVGHSASLVQIWVAEDGLQSAQTSDETIRRRTLKPVADAESRLRLRVFGPGRLAQLRERFDAGLRPTSSLWQGYAAVRTVDEKVKFPTSHFDASLLILRQERGKRFGLESTLMLTKTLRDTLMSRCSVQPPPEWLAGHDASGKPSRREHGHMAILPLPHVGRPLPHIGRVYADGHLLGLAIAVPRDVSHSDMSLCLGRVLFDKETGWPNPIKLTFGHLGDCELLLDEREDSRESLQSATWTGPARRWATVTPIALDRHAKSLVPLTEIEESVAAGCERIGLPRPTDVIAVPVSMFVGAPHAREMPRIERKQNGGRIRQTHAIITFPCAVQGPVLIGAGRYRGYGLCRPLARKEAEL
jgi:CRISPR-associated protein Csb2